MSSAKYNSAVTEKYAVDEIACSARTTSVDLAGIKDSANMLLGKGFAFAWSVKFALHGLKLKAGDFVSFKGKKMVAEEFQAKIRSKENLCTEAQIKAVDGKGLGKDSNKKSVTATRLVRAFAADISNYITRGGKVPDDLSTIADAAGLPHAYSFLGSEYGLETDKLAELADGLYKFNTGFDSVIAAAYASDIITGSEKHSHADSFVNYCKWRGIELTEESETTVAPAKPKAVVKATKK